MIARILKRVAVFTAVLLLALGAAAAWTGHWRILWVPSPESAFGPLAREGALALREGLPVAVFEGTPEEMGRRHGELFGPIIRRTLIPFCHKLYKEKKIRG